MARRAVAVRRSWRGPLPLRLKLAGGISMPVAWSCGVRPVVACCSETASSAAPVATGTMMRTASGGVVIAAGAVLATFSCTLAAALDPFRHECLRLDELPNRPAGCRRGRGDRPATDAGSVG